MRTPRRSRRNDRGYSNDKHHVRTETQIRQPVRPGACKPTGGFQPVLQIKFPRAARRYRMRHCPAKTVMGDFLVDAEALLAARLERVSLDDISRQAQPNPL